MNKDLKISSFDYPLPEERIAKFPLPERDASKLLVWRGGQIAERSFSTIAQVLPEGSMLVFNDTRVVRARIVMHKPSGARIEVFCLEPHTPADYERAFAVKGECSWHCMAGNLKKWKDTIGLEFSHKGCICRLEATRGEASADGVGIIVHFRWDADLTFGELLELLGRTPIPPYLCRESEQIDEQRYQTVYARLEGSVAAPTAGLHFSNTVMEDLQRCGVAMDYVTLHVGAGTFLPVKSESVADHAMHTEHFVVELDMLRRLRDKLGHVVAVGTTTVRTLESLAALAWRIDQSKNPDLDRPVGQWEAYDIPETFDARATLDALIRYMEEDGLNALHAATCIMITPGFRFRIVDQLVTNFHQPKSTLLLLVSAFTGGRWREIYDYALGNDFRFLSYGDSSILWRN